MVECWWLRFITVRWSADFNMNSNRNVWFVRIHQSRTNKWVSWKPSPTSLLLWRSANSLSGQMASFYCFCSSCWLCCSERCVYRRRYANGGTVIRPVFVQESVYLVLYPLLFLARLCHFLSSLFQTPLSVSIWLLIQNIRSGFAVLDIPLSCSHVFLTDPSCVAWLPRVRPNPWSVSLSSMLNRFTA